MGPSGKALKHWHSLMSRLVTVAVPVVGLVVTEYGRCFKWVTFASR